MKGFIRKITAIIIVMLTLNMSVFAEADFKVKLNNLVLEFNESTQYPTELDGGVYVPVRKIAESANAVVDWVDNFAVINIRGKEIKIKNEDKIAMVNGEEILLEHTPVIMNNRTFVSMKDAMQLFDFFEDISEYEEGIAIHQSFYK